MSILNAELLLDGVVSTTGGTALPIESIGSNIERHKAYYGGTTYLDRSTAMFNAKAPIKDINSVSGYTQARNTAKLAMPIPLADGSVVFNTLEIKFAVDAHTTLAQKTQLLSLGAQVLADTDFVAFWVDGNCQ